MKASVHPTPKYTVNIMHEFEITLDRNRFENTSILWNDLMLSNPWSTGDVPSLIESRSFARKEQWEDFYYKSGKRRNLKIAEMDSALCSKLNDDLLVLKNRKEIRQLNKETLKLNYCLGRTPEQLTEKAVILFQEAMKRSVDITIQECIEFVRFKIIHQTWNEVAMRERNTISILRKIFPDCKFVSAKGDNVHKFGVDYEIFREGGLTCGIRIKPEFYAANTPFLFTSPYINDRKKLNYSEKTGKPVFTVIAKRNGEIINAEVISKISLLAAVNNYAVFVPD